MDDQDREDVEQISRCLVASAHAGGVLEVRRLVLSRTQRDSWEPRRFTLSQQVEVGAYAHVLQSNGRRWVWTTSQGRRQLKTLGTWVRKPMVLFTGSDRDELYEEVSLDVWEAMKRADPDRRSRRCAPRGFDLDAALTDWDREREFRRVAMRQTDPSEIELRAFLEWWWEITPKEEIRAHRGLPVGRSVLESARRQGLAEEFMLVESDVPMYVAYTTLKSDRG